MCAGKRFASKWLVGRAVVVDLPGLVSTRSVMNVVGWGTLLDSALEEEITFPVAAIEIAGADLDLAVLGEFYM